MLIGKNKPATTHLRPRPLKLKIHSVLRWLHIYLSMFSLLAILFFALTGITLNHPDWAFTSRETTRETTGQLPANWKTGEEINWLRVVEWVRAHNNVRGAAGETQADENEGSVSFRAPGYNADCVIDTQTGSYDLTVTQQNAFGVLNDLHRGSESNGAWKSAIDVSGVLLTLVAVTGLGLLFYLKKVRVAALLSMVAGAVLVWILIKLTT